MASDAWPGSRLGAILAKFERQHGPPAAPAAAGPFEMVLWEIVAYLADDDRRGRAFQALGERVGTTAEEILAAPEKTLIEVTRTGGAIAAEERAERLREAARIVRDDFGGDLGRVLSMPPAKAKKALMRFPMIGEPGAEKILSFAGRTGVLALDSNGLRVLVRIGIGEEGKSYAATYRSVREATLEELPASADLLRRAHLLLRAHGQRICLRNGPLCHECAVCEDCRYGTSAARAVSL